MKIKNFFTLIILFIISSLSVLAISAIRNDLAILQQNIQEQNKLKFLELLISANQNIFDEHQRARTAQLYGIKDSINYSISDTAVEKLIAFSTQNEKRKYIP